MQSIAKLATRGIINLFYNGELTEDAIYDTIINAMTFNPVAEFLTANYCISQSEAHRVGASELYGQYLMWLEERGYTGIDTTIGGFGRQVKRTGVRKKRFGDGHYWIGIIANEGN